MRTMVWRAGCALLLLLALAGRARADTTVIAPAVPVVVAADLPEDTGLAGTWPAVAAKEGLYFRLNSFIASDYLALLPDSTYQFITQSDFSMWATDTGEWRFSNEQSGVLISAWQTEAVYANIDAGSFTVRVANHRDFLRLPEIRTGLDQFLQTHSGTQFTFSGNPGLAAWLGIIPRRDNDKFTRAEIKGAVAALDTALASARPLTMPFLICSDAGFAYIVSADTVERNMILMSATRARDRLQRYSRGTAVAASITRDEFERMRRAAAEAAGQ